MHASRLAGGYALLASEPLDELDDDSVDGFDGFDEPEPESDDLESEDDESEPDDDSELDDADSFVRSLDVPFEGLARLSVL
ncbi:MAG TPA: hypothetical protein VIK54_09800 [Acidimicrobiia bacterium]